MGEKVQKPWILWNARFGWTRNATSNYTEIPWRRDEIYYYSIIEGDKEH
jgi:hypothetical protein